MTRCLDSTICWQWLCWCHKWNQKLIEIGKQILRSMTCTTRELEREGGHVSGSTGFCQWLRWCLKWTRSSKKIPRSTTRERGRGHLPLDIWLNWLWMSRYVVSQNGQENTKSCTTRCTTRERGRGHVSGSTTRLNWRAGNLLISWPGTELAGRRLGGKTIYHFSGMHLLNRMVIFCATSCK